MASIELLLHPAQTEQGSNPLATEITEVTESALMYEQLLAQHGLEAENGEILPLRETPQGSQPSTPIFRQETSIGVGSPLGDSELDDLLRRLKKWSAATPAATSSATIPAGPHLPYFEEIRRQPSGTYPFAATPGPRAQYAPAPAGANLQTATTSQMERVEANEPFNTGKPRVPVMPGNPNAEAMQPTAQTSTQTAEQPAVPAQPAEQTGQFDRTTQEARLAAFLAGEEDEPKSGSRFMGFMRRIGASFIKASQPVMEETPAPLPPEALANTQVETAVPAPVEPIAPVETTPVAPVTLEPTPSESADSVVARQQDTIEYLPVSDLPTKQKIVEQFIGTLPPHVTLEERTENGRTGLYLVEREQLSRMQRLGRLATFRTTELAEARNLRLDMRGLLNPETSKHMAHDIKLAFGLYDTRGADAYHGKRRRDEAEPRSIKATEEFFRNDRDYQLSKRNGAPRVKFIAKAAGLVAIGGTPALAAAFYGSENGPERIEAAQKFVETLLS